jgi:hypothetical protein
MSDSRRGGNQATGTTSDRTAHATEDDTQDSTGSVCVQFVADRGDPDAQCHVESLSQDPTADVSLRLGAEFGGITVELARSRAIELARELLTASEVSR